MDVPPDRVEIELDEDPGRSRARGHRRRARGGPAPGATPPSTQHRRWPPRSDRALLAGVAALSALAGSSLTWAVARTRDAAPVRGTSTVTATTVPASTAPSTTAGATTVGVTLPAATAPPSPTTTEPARTTRELGRTVLPIATGGRVVGLAPDGDLLIVDLDTGRVDDIDVPWDSSGGAYVVPGSDRTLLGSWRAGATYVVSHDGGTVRAPDVFSYGGPILAGDRPDSAWVQRFDRRSPYRTALELVSFDGEALTAPIDVAGGWPNLSDHRGGVLVEAPGGTYAVGAEGAQRLTTGRVVAAGVNHVLVRECDESLQCTLSLVERDSGDRLALPADLPLGDGSLLPGAPSIAPDGRGMVVFGERGPAFGLLYVDVSTGASVPLDVTSGSDSVGWTADGRYVIALSGLELIAVDRTTLAEVDLPADLPLLSMFVLVDA